MVSLSTLAMDNLEKIKRLEMKSICSVDSLPLEWE